MQLVTVGTKYQIVIPKEIRKKIKSIIPGAKVGIQEKMGKVTIEPLKASWVEDTKGIMTKAWKGIDPIKELEKMRNEW